MRQQQAGLVAIPEDSVGGLRPRRTTTQNVASFFRRKPMGAFGAVVAALLLLVAIFAPLIATHDQYRPEVERVFAMPSAEAWLGVTIWAATCLVGLFMEREFRCTWES